MPALTELNLLHNRFGDVGEPLFARKLSFSLNAVERINYSRFGRTQLLDLAEHQTVENCFENVLLEEKHSLVLLYNEQIQAEIGKLRAEADKRTRVRLLVQARILEIEKMIQVVCGK